MEIKQLTSNIKRRNRLINLTVLVIILTMISAYFIKLVVESSIVDQIILCFLFGFGITLFYQVIMIFRNQNTLILDSQENMVVLNSYYTVDQISKVSDLELNHNYINGIEVDRKSAYDLIGKDGTTIQVQYKKSSLLEASVFDIISMFI